FLSPLTHGDVATVEVTVSHVGASSLRLSYVFSLGERRTAEGFEARVFAREAPGGIERTAIPESVRLRLK
ncbi:MAG: hypothetical protein AAFU55_05480, partial [Pseudomonadota bacterium]